MEVSMEVSPMEVSDGGVRDMLKAPSYVAPVLTDRVLDPQVRARRCPAPAVGSASLQHVPDTSIRTPRFGHLDSTPRFRTCTTSICRTSIWHLDLHLDLELTGALDPG